MKLYAKVRSERAEKGQGGNDYLDIDIFVGDGKNPRKLASFRVAETEGGFGLITESGKCLKWLPLVEKVDCGCEKDVFACAQHAKEYTRHCKGCGVETWSHEKNVYGLEDGLCDGCWEKKEEEKGKRQKGECRNKSRLDGNGFGPCATCGKFH